LHQRAELWGLWGDLRGVRESVRSGVSATNHAIESDADMPLREFLSSTWDHIQANLLPWLAEELGPVTDTHKRLISTLELACIETFMRSWPGLPGRPLLDRAALARAFVAANRRAWLYTVRESVRATWAC
jgi:hypothetical protein